MTCDYTTLSAVHAFMDGKQTADTTQDAVLLDLIRSTAREAEGIAHREFYPEIETRKFDTPHYDDKLNFINSPDMRKLPLDEDLLSITTLTNGDGTVVTSSQYVTYPANEVPAQEIRILRSSGLYWLPSTGGDPEQAISVKGVWGYHPDYAVAWEASGATLSAAITTTTATTFTCTTGIVVAGDLLQIDSEWFYVTLVTVGASDTITVQRGVNGSTAATHSSAAVISRWVYREIEMLVRTATVAYSRLRENPTGETIRIGADSFQTPKDVQAWLRTKLRGLGLVRTAIG